MRLISVCLFILSGIDLPGQVKIIEYSEESKKILMTLELEPFSEEQLSEYFDESLPGQIAVPGRSIILGIPYCKNANVSFSVKAENSYKYIPRLNPETSARDSVPGYSFRPSHIIKSPQKETVISRGYLWIGNIYCIHLDIRQCSYNDESREMTELIKIELEINLSGIITTCKEEAVLKNPVILNLSHAINYAVPVDEIKIQNTAGNWINYNKNYVKIKTARDGIYRITYEDLENIIPALSSIDPASFSLVASGKEYPVYVSGEENHLFEPGEFIEFTGSANYGGMHREINSYNTPYNEYFGRYSDTTVSWLSWYNINPLRARLKEGNLSGGDTIDYYYHVDHYEQNNWFDFSTDNPVRKEYPYWTENKTWNWHSIAPGIKSYSFNIRDIVPGKEVSLFAKLQGYASSELINSYLVGLSLNDYPMLYDSGSVNKFDQKLLKADISPGLLNEGINNLKIHSFPTSSPVNLLFFDWYEIEYPRFIELDSDSLLMKFKVDTLSPKIIKINNAGSKNYSVWKTGTEQVKYTSWNYNNGIMTLADTLGSGDKIFISSEDKILNPVIEAPLKFSNLGDSSRRADYIFLTSDELIEAASDYCSFIESAYQIKTAVINVRDVYDEFSFGNFNPGAIRDFLNTAFYRWQPPAPAYLFIAGDADYDYYGNKEKNLGSPPCKNIVPSFGSPVSDNWFICWDTTGAYIPMMQIGRLPAKSPADIEFYLQKHKRYKEKVNDDWNKRYLFFSGGTGSNQQQLDDLKKINDEIAETLIRPAPVGGCVNSFYKTLNPVTNFGPFTPGQIRNAIDSSGMIISYIGHSGTQTWDNGIADPGQLNNSFNRYPLVTDFGCSTGKFAEPDVLSFAELFLLQGQAIAYIGNSSLGFLSTSTLFPYLFYDTIFRDSIYCVSDAHRIAKLKLLAQYGATGTYGLFALTNIYFGDPLIALPVPVSPDIFIDNSSASFSINSPDSKMDTIYVKLQLLNSGTSVTDSFYTVVIDDYKGKGYDIGNFRMQVPLYKTTLDIPVPVNDRPGIHRIKIIADKKDEILELREDNNYCEVTIYVNDSNIRSLNPYSVENGVEDTVKLLLPVTSRDKNFIVEYGRYPDFRDAASRVMPVESFNASISLKELFTGGRLWLRAKMEDDESWSLIKSFYTEKSEKYSACDSFSMKSLVMNGLKVQDNKIVKDTEDARILVISGGFHDGKTSLIEKDGQTYIPEANIIGHHVCLFHDKTFEFAGYRRFDVYGGGQQVSSDYYRFLDTLTSDFLICISVNDEGRVNDSLKQKLREFGSILIDSLRFRSSWAMIGKRGAARGSVPEKFTLPFTGKAIIDTTFPVIFKSGTIVTPVIGPSGKWKTISVDGNFTDTSGLNIVPVGINKNGEEVRLAGIKPGSSTTDISFIDNGSYPYLKLELDIKCQDEIPVTISSTGCNYLFPAELIVSACTDKSVYEQGSPVKIIVDIFNAGETAADSFNTQINILRNNAIDTFYFKRINNLSPGGQHIIEFVYFPVPGGKRTINVYSDTDNEVYETFEDNNEHWTEFYVSPDSIYPSVRIFFDEKEIFDGDFVSASPSANIQIYDDAAINIESSATKIFLDNRNPDPENLIIKISDKNPRAVYSFSPLLDPGEHILEVTTSDIYGNKGPSQKIRFSVSKSIKPAEVYNYPNPFKDETWFTMILPSIPDELKINIYTAAGRMIRQILKKGGELSAGFNKILWDGRDQDRDPVSNGVYFYKVISQNKTESCSVIGKLAKIF